MACQVLGPFSKPPYEPLICSNALVPKHEAGNFRLIYDLCFPRGSSANSNIPKYETEVCYDKIVFLVK